MNKIGHFTILWLYTFYKISTFFHTQDLKFIFQKIYFTQHLFPPLQTNNTASAFLCCRPSHLTGPSEEWGVGQVEVFRSQFPMMFLLAPADGFSQPLLCHEATSPWRSLLTIIASSFWETKACSVFYKTSFCRNWTLKKLIVLSDLISLQHVCTQSIVRFSCESFKFQRTEVSIDLSKKLSETLFTLHNRVPLLNFWHISFPF